MITALNLVLPVFFIILAGMLTRKITGFKSEHSAVLVNFALKITIPCMVFLGIYQQNLNSFKNYLSFFLSLSAVIIIIFTLATLYAKYIKRLNIKKACFFAASACLSNACMLAFPILHMLMGHEGAIYGIISVIVLIFGLQVMNILADWMSGDVTKSNWKKCFQAIIKSFKQEFFIAFILGIIFSFFHIGIPTSIKTTLTYLANATAPAALFAVGINLDTSILKGNLQTIIEACAFKLILMPITAYLLALLFNLSLDTTFALIICSSIATAKCQYAVAKNKDIYAEETASIVAGTTLMTICALIIVLYIFQTLHPEFFHQLN